MRIGFYPGSFDPVTFGHVDVMARAARLVDKLVVGVGTHGSKQALLTPEHRVTLIKEVLTPIAQHAGLKFDVVTFSGLTVDAAKAAKANVIIRGLRDATDFDYEVQMAQMNGALTPEVETVFLASSPATRMMSSSLVKQIAKMGGDTSLFLPAEAQAALTAALAK